jgi:hypothetical protein
MVDVGKAAERLVDMALLHAFLNNRTPDEVALQLIATFEAHKHKFTQDEQDAMRQIVLRAVRAITDGS